MRAALVDRPIVIADLVSEVASAANGATVLFIGSVRGVNDGRPVSGIDYAAYRSMAEKELTAIVAEAVEVYGTSHVVVEHRLGYLPVGEPSVVVAAAHPRRAQAFEAAQFVIEELKRRVPVWKLEHYVDGTREWANPTAPRSSEECARQASARLAAHPASRSPIVGARP